MTAKGTVRRSAGVIAGVLLVVSAWVAPGLWADTIISENDVQYEGDVLSDDKDMIILRTDRGIMYFNRNNIKAAIYAKFPNSSAKVQEVIGSAQYQRKAWRAADRWEELTVGTKLRPGDTMRTGDDSKVVATVAGQGVLAVEANSFLTVAELRRNKEGDVRVRLALDTGQLWNDVGALKSARSAYTVETPQASCGVRGTVYTVLTEGEGTDTTIATVEGTVEVVQKQEDGATVQVGANEQTSLGRTGDAETAAIAASFIGQWDGYSVQFQRLRSQMQLEDLFKQYGLTPQQGYMIAAGGIGLIVLVLGIVIVRSRRR